MSEVVLVGRGDSSVGTAPPRGTELTRGGTVSLSLGRFPLKAPVVLLAEI